MRPIDTNTRLPLEDQRVLAYYPERGWQFASLKDDHTFHPYDGPTHWLPLPEAPTSKRRTGYTPDFEEAFRNYDRKGSKAKAFKYWQMLTPEDRAAIIKAMHAYCQRYSGPDFQFRKDFDGWINPDERRWERPINDPSAPASTPVKVGWITPS